MALCPHFAGSGKGIVAFAHVGDGVGLQEVAEFSSDPIVETAVPLTAAQVRKVAHDDPWGHGDLPDLT